MMKQIFLNLPVKNLQLSVTFFAKLGFTFDPRFSDEKATCMIIGENIYAMLLTEPFFQTFTSKGICDTAKSTETLICLPCESRAQVDDLISKAAAAGAKIPRELQEMDMSMATPLKTWTATLGNSSIWIQAKFLRSENEARPEKTNAVASALHSAVAPIGASASRRGRENKRRRFRCAFRGCPDRGFSK